MDVLAADWSAICARIVAKQRELFEASPEVDQRTVYEGVGEGGDRTLEIDRRCEDVVFAELEALAADGASFVAVSEERGEVELGGGGAARVVVDPIDGSLNARRTVPSHSLSLAVAAGPSMAEVEFGYVYDFGAREEFAARRGEGATLDGRPISVAADDERIEMLGVEAASPRRTMEALAALDGTVYRLRVVGSIAIAGCYVAAGRFDAMLSLRDTRSVDAAAAQLIVREAGGEVSWGGRDPAEALLDLESRYPVGMAAGEGAMSTIASTGFLS